MDPMPPRLRGGGRDHAGAGAGASTFSGGRGKGRRSRKPNAAAAVEHDAPLDLAAIKRAALSQMHGFAGEDDGQDAGGAVSFGSFNGGGFPGGSSGGGGGGVGGGGRGEDSRAAQRTPTPVQPRAAPAGGDTSDARTASLKARLNPKS